MLKSVITDSVLISFAGGVLALDRTAAFQAMISRPIVTGPVIGFLLGRPEWGLVAGVILELIFIGDLPVGRYVPLHETCLTVVVSALTITALDASGAPPGYGGLKEEVMVLPLMLLITVPVSRLFQKADIVARHLNARLYENALSSVGAGSGAHLVRDNLKGLGLFFTSSAVALLITLLPLMALVHLFFSALPANALMPAFIGCVVLGISSAINSVAMDKGDKGLLVFCASAVISSAVIIWVAFL
ncbi:MAG: PTS sugar transporter subunit IIC [Deltaproteobacteria bacterium]|nr:PTS sugar transporter subunit IIC [Deltaproteobacteria bacterium]